MVDLHLFEWRGHGRRLTADTLQAAGGILPFPVESGFERVEVGDP
ncbi:hypothetical protein [Pseudomonas aeruginosa]